MKADDKRPIIIKRKKSTHPHHGGAWKIAFADFMTAMMALFLVLWILATSDPEQRKGISDYFSRPLLVALTNGDRDSSSDSVIPGGGPDPTYSEGEVRKIDLRQQSRAMELRNLGDLKRRLEEAIDINPLLKDFKDQILIDLIPEGLRIQLVDSDKRPMFQVGSAKVAPYMSELLRIIAPILNKLSNSIQISGHTDSLPYVGGDKGYSNWELSADRANASRKEMVIGGLDSEKLIRVSGMADILRFQGAEEMDAINRRIAIIVIDSYEKRSILNQHDKLLTPDQLEAPDPFGKM